jgi:hypothetical protein
MMSDAQVAKAHGWPAAAFGVVSIEGTVRTACALAAHAPAEHALTPPRASAAALVALEAANRPSERSNVAEERRILRSPGEREQYPEQQRKLLPHSLQTLGAWAPGDWDGSEGSRDAAESRQLCWRGQAIPQSSHWAPLRP